VGDADRGDGCRWKSNAQLACQNLVTDSQARQFDERESPAPREVRAILKFIPKICPGCRRLQCQILGTRGSSTALQHDGYKFQGTSLSTFKFHSHSYLAIRRQGSRQSYTTHRPHWISRQHHTTMSNINNFSTEAVIGFFGVLVALPPAILIIWRLVRRNPPPANAGEV
jgi:hypothetical protein